MEMLSCGFRPIDPVSISENLQRIHCLTRSIGVYRDLYSAFCPGNMAALDTDHRATKKHVFDLAWSPDSEFLIAGTADNNATIWKASTGKSRRCSVDREAYH